MNQQLRDDPEAKKYYENLVMLKTISQPSEQAGAVIYLLSDYSSCSLPLSTPSQADRGRYYGYRDPGRWWSYGLVVAFGAGTNTLARGESRWCMNMIRIDLVLSPFVFHHISSTTSSKPCSPHKASPFPASLAFHHVQIARSVPRVILPVRPYIRS